MLIQAVDWSAMTAPWRRPSSNLCAGLGRSASGESGSCGSPRLCLHRAVRLSSAVGVWECRFRL